MTDNNVVVQAHNLSMAFKAEIKNQQKLRQLMI